jgi:26S proteasome regulatory subunit T2
MGQDQSLNKIVPAQKDEKDTKKGKGKWEPPPPPTQFGKHRSRRKRKDSDLYSTHEGHFTIPRITAPSKACKLKQIKLDRVKDYLILEKEFASLCQKNKEEFEARKAKSKESVKKHSEEIKSLERKRMLHCIRGSLMVLATVEEIVDDDHIIVTLQEQGVQYYVPVASIVDKARIFLDSTVLLNKESMHVVGVLSEDADPTVSMMRLNEKPTETFADIGGLSEQIEEVKEAVEYPLKYPELYEDIGIKPPRGVIFYGPPGTGKTLIAKAVASETSATFLHMVGSELVQKYLGEGPRLVRELFRVAKEEQPSIVFIDEIDAIGTKRYEATCGGEREIQRTLLELLNQLDGFDQLGQVQVVMATNRIDTLDPALLRPGRIDRKIEFPLPDEKTKKRIFHLLAAKMNLGPDVKLDEILGTGQREMTGADLKAICIESGLRALRERRTHVIQKDFLQAKEAVLSKKKPPADEFLYL